MKTKDLLTKLVFVFVLFWGGMNGVKAADYYVTAYVSEIVNFRVVDENGEAIPDVRIDVWFPVGEPQGFVSATGNFSVLMNNAGVHYCLVRKAGYADAEIEINCLEYPGRNVPVAGARTITLYPGTSTLTSTASALKLDAGRLLAAIADGGCVWEAGSRVQPETSGLTFVRFEAVLPRNQRLIA